MRDEMTARQAAFLCGYIIIGLKIIALPSLLYQFAEFDGILIAAFLLLFNFLVLCVAIFVKQKFPNASLYDLLKANLGAIITKSIYILIAFFYICKMAMLIGESMQYIRAIVDEDITLIMFLIVLLPVVGAMIINGLRSFARTAEMIYPFVLLGLVVTLLLSNAPFNVNELGPFFVNGVGGFLNNSFNISFWFADFMFLFIVLDRVKIDKNFKKTMIFNTAIMTIVLIALYIIYFNTYRTVAFFHKNAIADISQYKNAVGNIGNPDIAAIFVYMFALFFQAGVFCYTFKIIYQKVFEYQSRHHGMIVFCLITIILQLYGFDGIEKIIGFATSYLKYYSILTYLLIPLYLTFLLIFEKKEIRCGKYKKLYKKN